MYNKILGLVMALICLSMIIVDYSFISEFMARGLELHKTCPLPPDVCPFIAFPWQGIFIAAAAFALMAVGIFVYRKGTSLHGNGQDRQVNRAKVDNALKKLENEEAQIYRLVADENGMLFQGKLIERTGFTKVKVSRILDSLESRGLIERKRRGMSNVVVLK